MRENLSKRDFHIFKYEKSMILLNIHKFLFNILLIRIRCYNLKFVIEEKNGDLSLSFPFFRIVLFVYYLWIGTSVDDFNFY